MHAFVRHLAPLGRASRGLRRWTRRSESVRRADRPSRRHTQTPPRERRRRPRSAPSTSVGSVPVGIRLMILAESDRLLVTPATSSVRCRPEHPPLPLVPRAASPLALAARWIAALTRLAARLPSQRQPLRRAVGRAAPPGPPPVPLRQQASAESSAAMQPRAVKTTAPCRGPSLRPD